MCGTFDICLEFVCSVVQYVLRVLHTLTNQDVSGFSSSRVGELAMLKKLALQFSGFSSSLSLLSGCQAAQNPKGPWVHPSADENLCTYQI